MFWQKTIRKEISSTGIGLHSGKRVKIVLKPAPANKGIIFRRTDIENFEIKASDGFLFKTDHATSISRNDICIDTVEHLMASFIGLGIDNVIVEIDSSEIPAMDGSASPFVYLLQEAGVKKLSWKRKIMRIKRPVEVREDDKFIAIYPSDEFKITYRIEFDHPAIQQQEASFGIDEKTFIEEIAPARTFGFLRDVEMLRKKNLARGGSLDNAIVLDEHKVINNPLRFQDEFVRHKILDAMGDLGFLPYRMLGHLVASKAGHAMHIKLFTKIMSDPDAWEILTEGSYEKTMLRNAEEAGELTTA